MPFLEYLKKRLGNDKAKFFNFNARLMIRPHIIYVLLPILTAFSLPELITQM